MRYCQSDGDQVLASRLILDQSGDGAGGMSWIGGWGLGVGWYAKGGWMMQAMMMGIMGLQDGDGMQSGTVQ